jgi:hypothetical protein
MGPVSWNQTGLTGAGIVVLDGDFLLPDQPALRAFVPTGSTAYLCQATMSETNYVVPGISFWCGQRTYDGVDGVQLTVKYDHTMPWPQTIPGFFLSFTVQHDGAQYYGEPVFVP